MSTTPDAAELRVERTEVTHRGQRAPRSLSWPHVLRAGLGRVRAGARQVAAIDKKLLLATRVDDQEPAPRSPSFSFEVGERRQVEEVGRLSGETATEQRHMYERLDRGSRYFIGRYRGEMAFYAWLMFGEMELGSEPLPTAPGVAYSYKIFTAPAFRRLGLARAYYAFLRPILLEEGCRRLICYVKFDNTPSLRLHRSVGFRQVGVIWDAHLGPLRRALLIPEARPRLAELARQWLAVDWIGADGLCRS